MTEPTYETPERAQAAHLRALYETTINEVRNNKDLMPKARNQQIKDLHAEGRARLDQLRQADRERLGAEYLSREKELFSGLRKPWGATGADMISIRDARDRADRLRTPAEAEALLRSAQDSRDHVLESAIAKVAADRSGAGPTGEGWAEVARTFIAAEPDSRGPLADRLAQLEDLVGPGGVFGDDFAIRQPPEARGGGFADTSTGSTEEPAEPNYLTRG